MLILNSMKHETNSIKDKGLVAKLKEDIRVMCCCIVVAVLLTLPQERDSGDTAPSATADTGTPGTLTGLPPIIFTITVVTITIITATSTSVAV